MSKVIKIHESDNVCVALEPLEKGARFFDGDKPLFAAEIIPTNHKAAVSFIRTGQNVIKYGQIIGRAVKDIPAGRHVHTHNTESLLTAETEYNYKKISTTGKSDYKDFSFLGYKRNNGKTGVRNELLIMPTVGCINGICLKIKEEYLKRGGKEEISVFSHPYGCSQLGGDLENTQKIMAGICANPNFGGILIVSLGCENNNLEAFKPFLENTDKERIRFLTVQDAGDEIAEGIKLIKELTEIMQSDKRSKCKISDLCIGIKCGGSDSLSGVTANPVVGIVSDFTTGAGGSVIMTEVPEMFGAEQLLTNRCKNSEIYCKFIKMIDNFKDYYIKHGEKVNENPSPGNREGGITTLEEKSLGCVLKGGSAEITDVLNYGDTVKTNGLIVLEAPGNDIIAQTALIAAGAQIIIFTTGRGTPLGAFVPTVKVTTNTFLAEKKPNWIDFDAGVIVSGDKGLEETGRKLLEEVLSVAGGKRTKNEINGCKDSAIWKNGVTL